MFNKIVLQKEGKKSLIYLVLAQRSETFAKHPLLPNLCACPVKCEAYFSGVRLNILYEVKL